TPFTLYGGCQSSRWGYRHRGNVLQQQRPFAETTTNARKRHRRDHSISTEDSRDRATQRPLLASAVAHALGSTNADGGDHAELGRPIWFPRRDRPVLGEAYVIKPKQRPCAEHADGGRRKSSAVPPPIDGQPPEETPWIE